MSATQIQIELNSSYYLNAISFTILFYDYFLTLPAEVARYWTLLTRGQRRWNGASILFFANRYLTLLGNIPVVIQYFWTTEPTEGKESALETYHEYFIVVSQIIVGVLLILRTYALYERNRLVLCFLLLIGVGVIVCGVYGTVFLGSPKERQPNLPLLIGCNYQIDHKQGIGLIYAWGSMGVFDIIIFFLTVHRALQFRRRSNGGALSLLSVLLRDGSIYFGVMVITNLCNIMTYIVGKDYTRGVATTFMNVISSVMISRLMLNIRDPALSGSSEYDSETLSGERTDVLFSTFLSSTENRICRGFRSADSTSAPGFLVADFVDPIV
ncbi:unnamed protein product [Mycena citricolor]|uniref:DUF6533 domain-containing protein n=1 Tax=Mycena citricolor TaxID=2018698 RepID=A0AAD2HB56_9AGAR|nr:unnamed protein product [Mycena citricolor]CAK5272721.1 unnamed protein product [Mycena citricolor]